MSSLIKKAMEYSISRRSFLGWSAALTTAAVVPTYGLKKIDGALAAKQAAEEGEWITAACWHNCGGRCLNKALVVGGVVVRQKTDDTHPDSPDFPQQRACWRGRSQKEQVFGIDRIKYPMRRKNWEPGGGKKELRGKDEWVRLSWDEALDLTANEIKRIKEKYGNGSILGEVNSGLDRTLGLYGGYASSWGSTSWGTWVDVGPTIVGPYADSYSNTGNDRLRLRESKLIIMWGANPAWSSGGNPTYNFLQAKKAGAKFIFIDPKYSDSAQVLADEWIPIRPSTDAAMLLGMAYEIIMEDKKRPTIDWEFLNKCTVGFDAANMPEGADPKGNFQDYILGTYDGIPKDANWASEICGVAPEKIRSLAIEYATTKPTAVICGGATSRTHRAEQTAQAFITLACMTGNIGIPGAGTGLSCHNRAGNAGPALVKPGSDGVDKIENPIDVKINQNEIWDAVLTGKYTAGKNDIRDVDIKMVCYDAKATFNQKMGANKGIKAHREKLEFVLSQSHFLTTQSKFADIVLPATTPWEKFGSFTVGNREILIFNSQVTQPLHEAKDDLWIATEIGKRLGIDEKLINPLSEKQKVFNQLAGAMVVTTDGKDYEPLVTITQKDINEWGVEGKPQSGRITLKEFKERGIYQVERSPGDNYGFTEFEDYRNDPEKFPRDTPSKKMEIYSQSLADLIGSYGWNEKSPIAEYDKPEEGYEDTFSDWQNKVKGEFPLQLYTIHYRRRSHSIFDNIQWLREAFPQEFFMSNKDAEERGIKHADIVKITSRHGSVIRPVYLTEGMLPGVVTLGEGAWIELDEETGIDKAGNVNMLNGAIPTGQGHMGANSCNVQVEKYNKPLAPDVEWPQRIVL